MTHEAAKPETFVQRYFWPLAVLFLGVMTTVVVLGFVSLARSTDDLRTELNDTYVEPIEIRSIPAGGGRYESLFVVDGVPRFDCSEEDGRLDCSDDPQPTLED